MPPGFVEFEQLSGPGLGIEVAKTVKGQRLDFPGRGKLQRDLFIVDMGNQLVVFIKGNEAPGVIDRKRRNFAPGVFRQSGIESDVVASIIDRGQVVTCAAIGRGSRFMTGQRLEFCPL